MAFGVDEARRSVFVVGGSVESVEPRSDVIDQMSLRPFANRDPG